MPPRIVTISDHVDCPTGFGVQHRHLALALAHAGYEVHSLGLWDTRPLAAIPQPPAGFNTCGRFLTRYPAGLGIEDHRRAWPMYRELLRPDLVITLGDFEMFRHLNDEAVRPFAWCHWLPVDALPYPARDHAAMLRYDHLILMSHFGLGVVRPHLEGRVPLHYIPHGVDTRVFCPLDDPLALRRRWSARLGIVLRPDDFLLIARDTNQWRKQQPVLLEALAQLPPDVKLLLHCAPVAHPRANGWDLPHLARLYGVADRVIFTSCGYVVPPSGGLPGQQEEPPKGGTTCLSPAELAELDNLADLRVSATAGEGFGVITLEAMACGTPTLITDYATSAELLLGIADCPASSSLPSASSSSLRSAWGRTSGRSAAIEAGEGQEGTQSVQDPRPHAERGDEKTGPLDPFGPAGELVRVAAWTVEQGRHLFRPVPSAADLAARVLALRDDPERLTAYGVAGLRRVLAHYTLGRVASDWSALVRRVLGTSRGS